ncbi:hypothetical protein KY284_030127 [Solanum tuberosum]|nr:hypothetical protein KY284_030127 [Solanum tuberosum]
MTHYQNILIGRYDFDLNETINESDCGLPQQDRNIAPSYGLDNYFGQSSHFEMTGNLGTSSNFHVSPNFDADDYRENITQDEPIDPVNIDDRDLPNYGTPSASDSDDLLNAEESGDNVPFEVSSSDDDFLMPNQSSRPMSMSPFRNHEIPYLDHLPDGPNIFGDTHDEYSSQRTWCEPEDFMNGVIYIEKGMLFNPKSSCREQRVEQGCRFRLTSFNDKHTNMWKVGRYIKEHTCDMGTCRDGHFNLDVEMIANVLRVDIEKTPRRKAYLGRKRAFEKVYGTWEGSFAELLRFMEALKHFNPRTIVEWKTEQCVNVIEDVFNYVFWTFKPCIDGFVFCRPVISIDGTHVYGKYDIKLLIAIATDGNGSILPLAFAIVANESMETWSLFLDHLHLHVVKGRRDVALILDRHHGILSSVDGGRKWEMLTTNSSESFNGLLKSTRGLPVTAMVRLTYNLIVNRFVTRSKFVNQLVQQKQQWMPKPFKIFEDSRKKSQRHTLINYHQQRKNIFEVQTHMHHGHGGNKHIVNASQGKCQCGKWQSYHIPCSHAIKRFDQIGYQAWEHMAPEFSLRSYKKVYSGQFNPLGGEMYWPDSLFLMIANKKYLRKVGVNKITRIHNEMDVPASTLTHKCSTCKQLGHDRRNYPSRARNASYGGSS